MAGPSIKVSFLSDFTKLKQGISDVGSAAKAGGGTLKDAFSPALAILNKSGVLGPFKEALDGVGEAIGQVKEHINDLPMAMAAAGAGVAGIGVALSALGSKDQAAHQQLQAAVEATGHSYDDYEKQVDDAIKKQEKFGHTATDTQDALRVLTQATNDPAKALQYLGTASDLAAAKHESLTAAAGQLGKTYNGATKLLKDFGVDAAPKAAAATKALEAATKGAQTADDAAARAKQQLIDMQARLAAGNHAAVVSTAGVTAAQDRLAAAQQHLSDLERIDAGKKTLTISQQIALRNAHEAVTKAVTGVATAQGKYQAAEAKAVAGTKLSVAQQQALRNAQQRVTDTSAKAKEAHEKLAAAQATATKASHGQADTMDALSKKLSGQAAASADTFAGKLNELKVKAEDNIATFGEKYGKALQGAGAAMAGLGGAMKAGQAAMDLAKDAALGTRIELGLMEGAQKVATAAQWLFNAAMDANPLVLLGVAIAAIVVVIVLLATKTHILTDVWNALKKAADAVWHGILVAIQAVWNWIKSNWPLLLGILLGPFGLAAGAIIRYRNQILQAIQAAWNWIKTAWPQLVTWLEYPFKVAWAFIATVGRDISQAFQNVISWFAGAWHGLTGYITAPFAAAMNAIKSGFNDLVGFVSSLPGRIAGAAEHMWDGMWNSFRGVVNRVIDLWNTLASHTALHIKVGIPHLPSINVNTPQLIPSIPRLAQGGLITNDGLIYAHAGEAITPIPNKAMGPAVNVEHAHFHQQTDMDLFLKRAAWIAQTRSV